MHLRKYRSLCLAAIVFAALVAPLVFAAVSPMGVELAWDYVQGETPAVKFNVWQQDDCADQFVFIASTINATTKTYTVRGLVAGKTYCWFVTAESAEGGESESSNSVSFRLPAIPPAKAVNLRGTLVP